MGRLSSGLARLAVLTQSREADPGSCFFRRPRCQNSPGESVLRSVACAKLSTAAGFGRFGKKQGGVAE